MGEPDIEPDLPVDAYCGRKHMDNYTSIFDEFRSYGYKVDCSLEYFVEQSNLDLHGRRLADKHNKLA